MRAKQMGCSRRKDVRRSRKKLAVQEKEFMERLDMVMEIIVWTEGSTKGRRKLDESTAKFGDGRRFFKNKQF